MGPLRIGALTVLCAVVALPGRPAAAAPPQTVGAAPLQVEGELDGGAVERLEGFVVEGLGRGDVVVIGPEQFRTARECQDEACEIENGQALGATHVVFISVTADGRNFDLHLKLVDTSDGSVVSETSQPCEICGVAEVGELLADQAAALATRVEKLQRPARISVTSDPSGAAVVIDGLTVGVTPYEDEIAEGEHRVEISKDGYIGRTRTVQSVEGIEEAVAAALQPVPETTGQYRGSRVGGAVALAFGGAALVSGATLLALHHQPVKSRCSGDELDDDGTCKFRYNSLPYGIPLVAAGVVGVAVGVALLVRVARKEKTSAAAARLQPVPWGLGVRF